MAVLVRAACGGGDGPPATVVTLGEASDSTALQMALARLPADDELRSRVLFGDVAGLRWVYRDAELGAALAGLWLPDALAVDRFAPPDSTRPRSRTTSSRQPSRSFAANPGGTPCGDRVTLTITADKHARLLTYISMLIRTNDGFTGVTELGLPRHVGDPVVRSLAGYDAGTEVNTEDFADIVPPCQGLIGVSSGEPGTGTTNPALAEGGVIRHHPGIVGGNDLLPPVHGWTDPVATIAVERVG